MSTGLRLAHYPEYHKLYFVSGSRNFCMWRLNVFIVVQLMQSWVKEFHLSTVRLLNAYFLMSSLLRFFNNLLECPLLSISKNNDFINLIYSIYDLKSSTIKSWSLTFTYKPLSLCVCVTSLLSLTSQYNKGKYIQILGLFTVLPFVIQ